MLELQQVGPATFQEQRIMQNLVERLQVYNQGRDPQLLALKYQTITPKTSDPEDHLLF
jgi:hypothetical protein